ncbi:MAG: hypothetical protein ACLUJG_12495 [Lawsonibacter sp.]
MGPGLLAADQPSLGLLGLLAGWALIPSAVFPASPLISPARSPFWPLCGPDVADQLFTDLAGLWRRPCSPARPPPPAKLRSRPDRSGCPADHTLFYLPRTCCSGPPGLTLACGPPPACCARAYILLRLWQLSRAMAPAPEASI